MAQNRYQRHTGTGIVDILYCTTVQYTIIIIQYKYCRKNSMNRKHNHRNPCVTFTILDNKLSQKLVQMSCGIYCIHVANTLILVLVKDAFVALTAIFTTSPQNTRKKRKKLLKMMMILTLLYPTRKMMREVLMMLLANLMLQQRRRVALMIIPKRSRCCTWLLYSCCITYYC